MKINTHAFTLWLDDIRPKPSTYTIWAKTADEAIGYLNSGNVRHCSLDHDLADEHYVVVDGVQTVDRSSHKEKTGYHVLLWMAEHDKWCPDITIHTMNPTGRKDMLMFLERHAPEHVNYRWIYPPEGDE